MWSLYALASVWIALLIVGALWSPRDAPGLRRLSVCLIVRNQAERLEGMVGEVIALAAHLRWCVADVVVVDDASTDETPVLLARLGRRHPGVKILNWPDDTDQGRQVLDAAYALCEGAWVLLGQARAGQSWCVSGHPRR